MYDCAIVLELESYEVVAMREYRTIPPQDLVLGEKIGEGQFGDVHNGYLYPKVCMCVHVQSSVCMRHHVCTCDMHVCTCV